MPVAIATDPRLEIGAYIYGPEHKPVCYRIVRTLDASATALSTRKIWQVEEITFPFARRRLFLKDIIDDYQLAMAADQAYDSLADPDLA